jgi:protein-disulfide isomerase
MTKTNRTLTFAVIALIAVLSVIGAGVYSMTTAMTALHQDVSSLRKEVNTATSPEEFQSKVANTLEMLAEKRREDITKAKFAKYALAEDSVPGDKNIYGSLDARFTLVEFSDTECPYCKQFHNTPIEIVKASDGNVNLQFMHLPLSFHNPVAKQQSLAAECVREQQGNKGFWAFMADIFDNTRGNGQGVSNLASIIEGVGADVALVEECLSSGRVNKKVESHMRQAAENGINGTPATFVVDNFTSKTQLLTGAQPPQAIMSAIRKMVAEQQEEQSLSGALGE